MLLGKQCRTVVWSVVSGGRVPESLPGDKLLSLPKLSWECYGEFMRQAC